MKRIFLPGTLALAGLAGLVVLAAAPPAQAQAQAPWCAVQDVGVTSYTDCQYWSLEECVPHVLGGNRGFCNPNPAYSGPAPGRRTYHRRRGGR